MKFNKCKWSRTRNQHGSKAGKDKAPLRRRPQLGYRALDGDTEREDCGVTPGSYQSEQWTMEPSLMRAGC